MKKNRNSKTATEHINHQTGQENIRLLHDFMRNARTEELIEWGPADVVMMHKLMLLGDLSQEEFDAKFAELFPDEAINAYVDVNGRPLPTGRNGEYTDKEKAAWSPDEIIAHQRKYLRDCVIPACRIKMGDMARSRSTLRQLEEVNPETAEALTELAQEL